MPDARLLQDLTPDELVAHAVRTEEHARRLADRMFYLEATIARALHVHSVPDRVCVCDRCRILRAPLRQSATAEQPLRARSGDVILADDPETA